MMGYRTFIQNSIQALSPMDSLRESLLQFWSLWDKQPIQGCSGLTNLEEPACHAILGGGSGMGWKNWNDEQTAAVMDLFHRQRQALPSFGRWVNALRPNADSIRYPDQLVFMPVDAFKHEDLYWGVPRPSTVFRSSGTSAQVSTHSEGVFSEVQRSRHWMAFESEVMARSMMHAVQCLGDLNNSILLALLPSYMDRGESSLLAMLQYFMDHGAMKFGAFYRKDYATLMRQWKEAGNAGRSTLVWGIPHALWDWFGDNLWRNRDWQPHQGDILIETGGTKGMDQGWTPEGFRGWLREQISSATGLRLGSEYGMTELSSQAYRIDGSAFEGFVFPASVGIGIYRSDNPLEWESPGTRGGINIVDTSNYYSLAFLQTADAGRILQDGSLELLGRLEGAETRGCNMLYTGG
ncbi:MAG: hypothetical protein FJ343_00140 [Sphingomonadales bacterium]|nr:hypothetical protein [Sphingomonadales bacterium]